MTRMYNGWEIETVGGFITIKRFIAVKGELWHWASRLKDCKEFCDARDRGEEIPELYLKPLYT